MIYYDVFNGDADGICALHQLRLAQPCESVLITGVKRDIALLKQVQANAEDEVLVLDISLDKNRQALMDILAVGAKVRYFDHHFAGDIPCVQHFDGYINTDADVCSSLLVNDFLNGAYLPWAVTAAFGDNLYDAATKAAQSLHLSDAELDQLKHLGTLLNYNGYGVSLDDLYFPPADLYRAIVPFESPFDFIQQSEAYSILDAGFKDDMKQADELEISKETGFSACVMLPNQAWARRVSGVYGNALARKFPDRAHALMTCMDDGSYRISVRAPLTRKTGADELCMQFPTGGGRKAAAGVNALPANMLEQFIHAFEQQYMPA